MVREDKPYHHQMRPYGTLGPPYTVSKHMLLYPARLPKLSWKLLEKKRLSEQLNKCFPSVYVVGHSVSLILNSIIQIALQIALMATNGALWYVASGIWGGVYFLFTGAFGIYLVYRRTYWNLIISYILHLFGLLMAIGAYLIVNIIAISLYSSDCEVNCFNHSVKTINYVCFFLGVVCIIMLLVYLILMPCYIMDSYNRRERYEHEQQIQTEYDKISIKEDVLMHSSLYAQNNLETFSNNKNVSGPGKSDIISYIRTNYNDYPVIQVKI